MLATSSQPVPPVIHQHAEESAILRNVRSVLVTAPHVKLHHLRRLDDRLTAHLDGLAVAGEHGWPFCEAALETPGVGEVFAATVRAIEQNHRQRLDKLLALAEAVPEAQPGLISAFGWVSAQCLQGMTKSLFSSAEPFRKLVGIAACAMHRVDPGPVLVDSLTSDDPPLRVRAIRTIGELGKGDLVGTAKAALDEKDHANRFWAAWSAVLLGDRGRGLQTLTSFCYGAPKPFRERAMQLAFRAIDLKAAHGMLQQIANNSQEVRTLIQGAGIAGDPYYVPWLINQMDIPELTRLAGESFSFISGLDLAYLDLDRKPPENFESGPNEDLNEENVEMESDEDLPWPDSAKIKAWWDANKHRFQSGRRYFIGAPVTREHCIHVLNEGYQRQRIAAALYLSLLNPGTPLFNTSAPAWRQQRWLAKMR